MKIRLRFPIRVILAGVAAIFVASAFAQSGVRESPGSVYSLDWAEHLRHQTFASGGKTYTAFDIANMHDLREREFNAHNQTIGTVWPFSVDSGQTYVAVNSYDQERIFTIIPYDIDIYRQIQQQYRNGQIGAEAFDRVLRERMLIVQLLWPIDRSAKISLRNLYDTLEYFDRDVVPLDDYFVSYPAAGAPGFVPRHLPSFRSATRSCPADLDQQFC